MRDFIGRCMEMGTYRNGDWRSALNPNVVYEPTAVSAWAVIEYPECPVRRWEAKHSGSRVGRPPTPQERAAKANRDWMEAEDA